MTHWRTWARAELETIDAQGRRRRVRDLDALGPRGTLDGRPVISFASNDYLGLSFHPQVISAARAALDRWGAGAGSARLIVGSRPVHSELERALAEWKGTPRAVLFPTGYAANLGALATFATEDTLICSDELNHASIVDACRLARGRVAVYPHNDLTVLAELLASADRAIVVSDAIFSMDGDAARIDDLAELCARHRALLILDEAHAVLGPYPGRTDIDALRVGTLSKFLGSAGGFVACDGEFADLLVNRARPFIFTTAAPPAVAAAALAALRVLNSPEGDALIARLRRLVDRIAPGHPSPIVPIVVGDEPDALHASRRLLERGLLAPAIRPPSVAPGTSRLRVTLSAAHTDEEVDRLVDALDDLRVPADA